MARVAFGANNAQTVKAFLEAEAYEGTSIIIAYAHCINQGYDLIHGRINRRPQFSLVAGH